MTTRVNFVAEWTYQGEGTPHPTLVELADDLCGTPWEIDVVELEQRPGESIEDAAARCVRCVFAECVGVMGSDELLDPAPFAFQATLG